MSAGIDTVRTEKTRDRPATDQRPTEEPTSERKALDVSGVPPERVAAYARATAAEGHPELYFERKGGRTYLVTR